MMQTSRFAAVIGKIYKEERGGARREENKNRVVEKMGEAKEKNSATTRNSSEIDSMGRSRD
jgi:hypothetical protein